MPETTRETPAEPCYWGPCDKCGTVHGGWETCAQANKGILGPVRCVCDEPESPFRVVDGGMWGTLACRRCARLLRSALQPPYRGDALAALTPDVVAALRERADDRHTLRCAAMQGATPETAKCDCIARYVKLGRAALARLREPAGGTEVE